MACDEGRGEGATGAKRSGRCTAVAAAAVRNYFENASLHGLRFVADSQRHWSERLFWLCCCLLSWYGSALLMAASWKAFQSNAISFATETNYKDWDTEFPSVHVCDTDNDQRIDLVRSQIESEDNRRYDLDEVYKEITYFSGEATFIKNTCYDMDGNFDNSSDCPTGNFTEIASQYRTPCNLTFGECEFNGKKFNCCDHFLALPTEIGVCYSFNSIQTHPVKAPLKTTSNSKVKAARIKVEVFINGMVFVLARQDVPTVNVIERAKFRITTGAHIRRFFSVKEVENDMQVRDTSTAQRRCRFPSEALAVLPAYSYSACVTQCRRDEQLRLCGCASHQTPNIRETNTHGHRERAGAKSFTAI